MVMVSHGNRIFLVSFVATFLVFSLAAVYLVYLPQTPTINHLPKELNVEAQDWMNYAPSDAEKVYVMNFTRVRSDLGSTDVFSNKELLTLYGYNTKVNLDYAYYSATALFPSADPISSDIALNIIEVSPTLSASLSTELTEKDAHPIVYGSHTIHTVLRSTGSSPAYVDGYLVLEGSHLLYSDTARGLEEVKKALDTRDRGGSYLDRPNIKAPYYLVSVSDELSFSYSTLPSGIKDVVTVSKSLSYDGKNVTLRCVYSFNDTDTAVRNLANIKALDFQGKEFAVYDNYIVSITDYGEGSLVSLLRSM